LVFIWADEPPPLTAEPRARRGEINFVVDLVLFAGPVIANGILQPKPAVSGIDGRRLKFDGKLVIVESTTNAVRAIASYARSECDERHTTRSCNSLTAIVTIIRSNRGMSKTKPTKREKSRNAVLHAQAITLSLHSWRNPEADWQALAAPKAAKVAPKAAKAALESRKRSMRLLPNPFGG